MFDECHKAKNFTPGKEQRSTKVALAVSMVQKMLPRARVVYCSATGVSNVKNMVSYYCLCVCNVIHCLFLLQYNVRHTWRDWGCGAKDFRFLILRVS